MSELTFAYLDPETLTPQEANPWAHPPAQVAGLSAVLDQAGWAGAALFNRRTGRLIDGHLRREEAMRRRERLPTLIGDWDPAQERLLLRSINPLAMLAQEEAAAIEALNAALAADFDAGALTKSDGLAGLLDGLQTPQPAPEPRDLDELPEKPPARCRPGDIWALGEHRILCASVTDREAVARLFGEKRAQTLITSPPYYGLRAYSTEPQVWGGGDCEHEWEDFDREGQSGGASDKQDSNAGSRFGDQRQATCRRCGAWRGELGLEPTPALYVEHMVGIFRALRVVMREDATAWVNMGDSYSTQSPLRERNATGYPSRPSDHPMTPDPATFGMAPKNLLGMPWRLAFALQADGWILRSDVIWSKPNPMPESVTDRPTKAHEYLFLLARRERYFYDADAVREEHVTEPSRWDKPTSPNKGHVGNFLGEKVAGMLASGFVPNAYHNPLGRNRRTVWEITPQPYAEAHFATYPVALVTPCLLAGTSEAGACPTCGAGWVRVVEVNPEYAAIAATNRGWSHAEDKRAARQKSDHPSSLPWKNQTLGFRPACRCPEAGAAEPIPQILFDPFLGAGTTMIAAEAHGRRCFGCELQPAYVDLCVARWERMTGQTAERVG